MAPPTPVLSVLSEAIEKQLDLARKAATDPGPDGVHDLRVATRRLRAALDLWLDGSPGKKLERCRKALRKLGRRLGSLREADVNRKELSDLRQRRPADAVAIDFVAAFEALRRGKLARKVGKALQGSGLPDLIREIAAETAKEGGAKEGEAAVGTVARGELGRRRPRLTALLGSALRRPSPRSLHRFRIELKKFRYSVELCAPAYDGRRVTHLVDRLKELQDELGAAHDAVVLHERFATLRRRLREDGLASAERSLLPPMRAAARLLRERQEAAVRGLEGCRREDLLSRFERALR